MVETHINAHIARVAELRQQAAALNGEADQLQQYIDGLSPQDEAVETETESGVLTEEVHEEVEKPKKVKKSTKGKK